MVGKWVDITGLVFALLGIALLAVGLIVTKQQALKIGVSRLAEDSDDHNKCLPHVRDRMRQTKAARTGVWLLVIGYLLQIVSSLLD